MLNTFIFFDLETTGLLTKTYMPKITELSLIAVSRSEIFHTTKTIPRVLSKLVLPINPGIYISNRVKEITELSNQNLENAESFTCETHDLIMNFVRRLVPPVCFVAYNGYQYDYPIFLRELENINKNISQAILCIDMLNLIKNYFSCNVQCTNSLRQESTIQANTSTSNTEDIDVLLDDEWNEILSNAESLIHENEGNESSFTNISDSPHKSYYEKTQKSNEKTPESQIIKSSNINLLKRKDIKSRRRLDFVNNEPSNFKLTTVYKHICGTDPVNAHSAEGDCLFMIECAIKVKQFFLEWADENAVPMINYKK